MWNQRNRRHFDWETEGARGAAVRGATPAGLLGLPGRERTGGVAGRDASVGMAGVGEAGRREERRELLGRDEKGQTLLWWELGDVDVARFE